VTTPDSIATALRSHAGRCTSPASGLVAVGLVSGWRALTAVRSDSVNLAIAIIGAIAAAAAAIAATGSWIAARKANETTAAVAAIERDRRHDELTPVFDFKCTARDAAPELADLRVELVGGRLERHAAVTVTILDESEQEDWTHGLPEGLTQDEAEAFVWGPWEFNTGASDQVVSNRQSKARPYSRVSGKNWVLLPLTATRPGKWMSLSQDEWRKKWKGEPVRLLVTCICDGYEPWFIRQDVTVEHRPHARTRVLE
jgi:hypothetical protein